MDRELGAGPPGRQKGPRPIREPRGRRPGARLPGSYCVKNEETFCPHSRWAADSPPGRRPLRGLRPSASRGRRPGAPMLRIGRIENEDIFCPHSRWAAAFGPGTSGPPGGCPRGRRGVRRGGRRARHGGAGRRALTPARGRWPTAARRLRPGFGHRRALVVEGAPGAAAKLPDGQPSRDTGPLVERVRQQERATAGRSDLEVIGRQGIIVGVAGHNARRDHGPDRSPGCSAGPTPRSPRSRPRSALRRPPGTSACSSRERSVPACGVRRGRPGGAVRSCGRAPRARGYR